MLELVGEDIILCREEYAVNSIMIVEDDETLREEVSVLLKKTGYLVKKVEDFSNVYEQMIMGDVDLILLDITLPGESGQILLQKFRKKSDIPVIVLTSRTEDVDELVSMSYGADDFITKPYNPAILLLRISAVLKRSASASQSQNYRGIIVSSIKGSLLKEDKEQVLTKNEMLIFQHLLDHQGEIVSREDLMTVLWDNDEYVNDNALSVNISRLRNKLSDFGLENAIETRKKQGYVLR
ncbi:response regulator transcription factor [Eubacterium xylanophilum]|uniref:response regulator transcription factor n=1 Tax=Eubacterium xylanophilum TaxID=39497 RepID=UPI00068758F6|nr:response regulator transcription factor [Eubacterium xylanophilum]